MRLKTSHGTFVVARSNGGLLHLPEPSDQDFQSVWNETTPPVPAPGCCEASITEGALAPSTLVVLADGLVAFRRDGLYLCAEPEVSEVHFNRDQVGAWEVFAMAAVDGTVVRQTVAGHPMRDGGWVDLQFVPIVFRPNATASIDEFISKPSSIIDIRRTEYIYAPLTIGYNDLKLFQCGIKIYYPTEFGKSDMTGFYMNKEPSKYILTHGDSPGIIFDKSGFYTTELFLNMANLPSYLKIFDNKIFLDAPYLELVPEEDVDDFIFYNGNYTNYYHWWIECLISYEIAAHYLGRLPPMIIWNGKPKLSESQIASLNILGIEIVHRESKFSNVVRLKEATWIDQARRYVPGFIYRNLRARALATMSGRAENSHKIYIKRKTSRSASNNICLEKLLIDRGYTIICCEKYSQIEQIEIFKSAKSVIATHGAGLTNMMFMPEGSSVIELMPSAEVRTFFWLMAEKLRHKYGVLICNSIDGHFDSAMEVNLLDLEKLINLVDIHSGFENKMSAETLMGAGKLHQF